MANRGATFGAVVTERRLKPLPLVVVEAKGDVPLASRAQAADGLQAPLITTFSDPSSWQFGRLAAAIEDIRLRWDLVLLDTGAGVHAGVTNLLLHASHLVLVTQNDPASYLGGYALLKSLASQRPVPDVFVIVNRATDLTSGSTRVRSYLESIAPLCSFSPRLLATIPEDSAVADGLQAHRPVSAAFPHSPAALAYQEATRTLAKAVWSENPPITLRTGTYTG